MQKTSKDYGFVAMQLILFLLFAVTPSVPKIPLFDILPISGLVIAVFGMIIILFAILQLSNGLTPFPSPKQGASLKTGGLYRFSRHPIYSGILLFCVGWTLYTASFSRLFITLAFYILFYFKSDYEEKRLVEAYGDDYTNYKQKTPRFFI